MKIGFLKSSLFYFSTCLILMSSASFISNIILSVQAGSAVYDFIDHASEAQWSSGAGALPFPGDPSDSRGFAQYVNNALLEDGATWSRVLETHPQWVSNGYIMGRYPQQTVPNNVQLTARVGFLSGATGTDGVIFEVRFLDLQQNTYTVLSHVATYDGKLDPIVKDLGYLAGKTGYFILYVGAGQTSNRDWAVWAEARIETKPLPDLVITDVWESNGLIHYKAKNIGDAATTPPGMPAKSFRNCLSIDGKQVAKHAITQVLKPGEEAEGVFNYAWQPTPGEHIVNVCADCEQDIEESSEENNCLEEKWLKENLPDLIITEISCDRNNSVIRYAIKNIGSELAKGNHSTTLYVDGKEVAHDPVGVDLKPGENLESWFKDYKWPECHNITVKTCVDNFNQIKESDEKNNCLEKTCISYPIPILITSGPSAVSTTQDSATIKWVTNKNSDSMVVYSDRSTGEEKTVYDPNLVKDHALRITGLKPRTTYRFYVKSNDICGSSAVSKTMVFETASPPDEEKPSVTLLLPERLVGVVNILAHASDNVGVGGVMFSIDKAIKFIDFSSPYVWVCNTTLYPNGVHSFDATAFDTAGNRAFDVKNGTIANPLPDTNPPDVRIVSPSDEGTVHGLVRIEALIQDREYHATPAGHIQKAEFYIDGALVRRWEYSPFRYDFLRREVVTEPRTSSLSFTHLWNTTGLEPGSEHVIEVKAWDDSGNYGRDSIRASILRFEWAPPPLEYRIIGVNVTRNAVRHDIYQTTYLVTLFVSNIGTETLYNLTLRDDVCGFQVIPHTAFMSVRFVPSFWTSTVIFKPPGEAALPPGGVATLQYFAVPILFAPTIPDDCYIFGWLDTSVSFSCGGTNYGHSFQLRYHPGDLSTVLRSADYIIITHPSRLFSRNPDDEDGVNSLLVEMAELARLKSGVLGYLRGELTAHEIKKFISPSGAWASRLSPVFRDPNPERDRDAYVLIVGETEIVPSFNRVILNVSIPLSDNPYSDTCYNDHFPDIMVGRIVGDTARNLTTPIITSIDVATGRREFDRSDALVTTGPAGPWEEVWVRNGHVLADLLHTFQGASVSLRHTEYYDTEVNLLREALYILGTYWDLDPDTPTPGPPSELRRLVTNYVSLSRLVGVYNCLEAPGHTLDGAPCIKNHPPMDLATLRTLISKEDAEIIEAVRFGIRISGGALLLLPYNIYETDCRALSERGYQIKEAARGKDIIVFAGHGGPGSWACCLDAFIGWCGSTELYTDLPGHPLTFGDSAPVVSAAACSTGYYETTDIGDISISEAFLKNGAAIYMGATISVGDESDEFHYQLYGAEWTYRTIGKAFALSKRHLIRVNTAWLVYAYHYNLYGDPKFGD
ncbi:MAG: hypothetical protein FGF53_07675 [Candidatus Brockarchaeota archaeon]|nr:hypothetical protein [Candidatus Brockarchaeota archaeon]